MDMDHVKKIEKELIEIAKRTTNKTMTVKGLSYKGYSSFSFKCLQIRSILCQSSKEELHLLELYIKYQLRGVELFSTFSVPFITLLFTLFSISLSYLSLISPSYSQNDTTVATNVALNPVICFFLYIAGLILILLILYNTFYANHKAYHLIIDVMEEQGHMNQDGLEKTPS